MLAVYGTLRVGQPNWRHMLGHCPYLGTHRLKGFAMFDASGIPVAVPEEASSIVVDLFDADPPSLQKCDRLEGHPVYYKRRSVHLGGNRAWVYAFDSIDAAPIHHGDWLKHVEARHTEKRQDCLYFAYGSNMNVAQMGRRCRDHRPVGVGCLAGFALALTTRGTATIIPQADSFMEGMVWSVSTDDIDALDINEGVANDIYFRHMAPITLIATGEKLPAYVYTATADINNECCRVGYANKILSGAAECGLSADYQHTLQQLLNQHRPV